MKLNGLLFCLIFALSSCHGQHAAKETTAHWALTVGDTVSELSNSVWVVFQATNGDHWFGSDTDGVYRFDGKTLIHYSTHHGLRSERTRGIQQDRQGNIYISNLGGIDKFDGSSFSTLSPIKADSSTDHWKLQADDLWFSTLGKNGEKGPYRYDGKQLYQLEFPKHAMADAYFERFPNNAWSPYEVYHIYKDTKGSMWFGTSNFGICRYDGKSLSWLYEDHLTNTPNGASFGIRSIVEDAKGKYWFCNTRYRYDISPDSIMQNGQVLVKYVRETGIQHLSTSGKDDHVYFMSAVKDNEGNLWLATYSQGVWKYDGKTATHYAIKDGSKAVTLFSIYLDREGELWLGTHQHGAYKLKGNGFEKFAP